MEPTTFFIKVGTILNTTKANNPIAVDYFILDIEQLIEQCKLDASSNR